MRGKTNLQPTQTGFKMSAGDCNLTTVVNVQPQLDTIKQIGQLSLETTVALARGYLQLFSGACVGDTRRYTIRMRLLFSEA